jgi:hypothetical protein
MYNSTITNVSNIIKYINVYQSRILIKEILFKTTFLFYKSSHILCARRSKTAFVALGAR